MEGIIYKVQPYQEHGRLLFTYTPHGKITLLAQGAQKMNQGSRILAQFLTKISFTEGRKSFIPLQDGKIINDYHHIKDDFFQTKSAALILEIIDHLVVDNQNHGLIYQEVMMALDHDHLEVISLSFALKMLKELGYGLDLSPDGRPIKGVSIERGSLIYQDDNIPIDLEIKDAIVLLKLSVMPYDVLQHESFDDLSKIKDFILKYYSFHLQTTLKNLQ